jgi:hypothetical protein
VSKQDEAVHSASILIVTGIVLAGGSAAEVFRNAPRLRDQRIAGGNSIGDLVGSRAK